MVDRILSHIRRQPVAYLALFVALGGTSYAAVKLPKNSVRSKQIKNNSVNSADLRNNKGVRGVDVAADTLTGADIDEGSLDRVPSAADALGASHAVTADRAGHAVSADSATEAGLLDGLDSSAFLGSDMTIRIDINEDVSPSAIAVARAYCQEGEALIGGGGRYIPSISSDVMLYSAPVKIDGEPYDSESESPRGWGVRAKNGDTDSTEDLYAFAICAG